jgi:methionyl-tRNA formyltransferase
MIFFGSGAFGLPTLQRLAARETIHAIVSQPDRPAGRGGHPTATTIAAWAAAHLPAVPILKPERVREPDVIARIRSLEPGPAPCFVVIAFGQKMPAELLESVFAINLHASLLPRWRGAAPINAAILAGDTVTGNSVITLADRMDAGLVLGQSTRDIPPTTTAGELHDLLSADGPDLVDQVLRDWRAGSLHAITQDEALVTKAVKLRKEDAWIDFAQGAEACRRRVHGLTPWPGVTVRFRGEDLKLLRVNPEGTTSQQPPGTIIDARRGLVACAASTLRLLDVQPAGKKPMTWDSFANGRRVADHEIIEGRGGAC